MKRATPCIASVIAALSMTAFACAAEGWYERKIRESGEVIGCSDKESFNKLLSATPIEMIAVDCRPHRVSGTLTFRGWTAFGNPQPFSRPDNPIAKKYVMVTAQGETIRFVWPYPLEMFQYREFSGPYREEAKEPPVFSAPIPNVVPVLSMIVYVSLE